MEIVSITSFFSYLIPYKFYFFLYFFIFWIFEKNNFNVDWKSMLTTERVGKRRCKWCKDVKNIVFGFLLFLCYFWFFFPKIYQKLGSNRFPFVTMLTKQNIINVLHSKIVKKKFLLGLLSDPLIQKLCCF